MSTEDIEIFLSHAKPGMYLIWEKYDLMPEGCGAVVTCVKSDGVHIRDTYHNNCYWLSKQDLLCLKFPLESHSLTAKEFADHGEGITDVNYALFHNYADSENDN